MNRTDEILSKTFSDKDAEIESLRKELEQAKSENDEFRLDLTLSKTPSYFAKVRQPLIDEISSLRTRLNELVESLEKLKRYGFDNDYLSYSDIQQLIQKAKEGLQ